MNKFLLTLLAFLLAGTAQARIVTAVANGTWDATSTWSPSVLPTNNDTVIVPEARIVTVDGNENMSSSYLLLRVMGTLRFVGGGAKLTINGQSAVFIFPNGKITADQNSQVIIIGSSTVLRGSNSGVVVNGPSYARETSSSTSGSTTPAGFQPYNYSTLPVKFVAFTAVRRNNEVLVQWSTSEEENAQDFEVELSLDGRSWSGIARIAAAGNSTTLRTYSFSARNLPAGTLQFRVKQNDVNGKFTYTAIRTVKAGIEGAVQLSSVSGKLVAQFGQEVKGATIRFMNLNGQVLQEQRVASAIGQVVVPTNLKGYVVVAVMNENEIAASRQLVF